MPLVRKIIDAGKTSRAVILPKSWLEFLEKENGQEIKEVTIEVDKVLMIAPILLKKEVSKHE
jgi:antitoxin component of MazEF toxin-antitoxin module